MTISFSSQALIDTVAIINAGKRDLQSKDLTSFYDIDNDALRNIDTRYEEVLAFRTNSGLDQIPQVSFVFDLTFSAGPSFFEKVQNGQGIEKTFTEDLIETDTPKPTPSRVGAFIEKESRKIAEDTEALDALLSFGPTIASFHLLEDDQAVIADEDMEIFKRLKLSHDYTRSLIK